MMPQLACNPILVTLDGKTADAWIEAFLTVQSIGRTPEVSETIPVKLRTNGKGAVNNFDISPLVAGVCRQNFDGDKERYRLNYDYGYNVWTYTIMSLSGDVLFGAGEISEKELLPPYLLRRNLSTIHVYNGLPGAFCQWDSINLNIYDATLRCVRSLSGHAPGACQFYFENLNLPEGLYYLAAPNTFIDPVWQDSRIWNDADVWQGDGQDDNAVFYPLHIHPSPADCIRVGAKIYVRYWNSRGAWSYALLSVLHNDLKAKTEYADSWRLDAKPVDGRILGDRVQTSKEMTYTITAGRDGLDRLEVDELRDLQRSWCVQVWDIDQEVWRDCYVDDVTTQNNGGCRQEMTFTLEMPHEYTFTR